MSHLLILFMSLCFLWSSVETTVSERDSLQEKPAVEVPAVKPKLRNINSKAKMTKGQRFLEAAEAVYKKSLREKTQRALVCGEEKYLDPVSDSCQECSQLCELSSPEYCQLYCPWKYAENQLTPEIENKLDVIYVVVGIFGVLLLVCFACVIYLFVLVSRKKNNRSLSPENASLLDSPDGSNNILVKAAFFKDDEISKVKDGVIGHTQTVAQTQGAQPETVIKTSGTEQDNAEPTETYQAHARGTEQERSESTETRQTYSGRTETDGGRLVTTTTNPVSDKEKVFR